MSELLYSPKIKPEHLARKAIVYLRQSSEKQVRQNLESQRLQYELAERIRGLGWQEIEVINSDLGCSAGMASASREGFERVLSSVALGEVGIVASREVSRLSRTDKDWCRLVEVCQIFGTLIGDEQQVYDLSYLDDQLVLGIKGTLSVVELKVLRQRPQAGQDSKARRGELLKRLPVGYARDGTGKVVLHPDRRIREAIQLVFTKFRELWSVPPDISMVSRSRCGTTGQSNPRYTHYLEDSFAEPGGRYSAESLLRGGLCLGKASNRDAADRRSAQETAGRESTAGRVSRFHSQPSCGIY
jgi:DNA invertase Pin-like site-specific DNA recombinase